MTSINTGNSVYKEYQTYAGQVSTTAPNTYASQTAANNAQNDEFVHSGETCTDGKDDGKIGFGSAVWNTIKGIGKTAVNMVKGCFTNKEGKFSLGKTLLTAATAAVCIAFPAVGLVACTIGAVAGVVQVGKGVYNALSADTDAEAKLAWQDVGGGVLTTGLSVAGAKASYNAVVNTSAAGATTALKAENPNAGLLAKSKALGKDMISSTTSRAGKIIKTINPFKKSNAAAATESAADTAAETATSTKKGLFKNKKSSNKVLNELKDQARLDGKKRIGLRDRMSIAKDSIKNSIPDFNNIKPYIDQLRMDGLIDKNPLKTMQNIMELQPKLIEKYGYENILAVVEETAGVNATDITI